MILCRSHQQLHRITVVRRCLWKVWVHPLCFEKGKLEQTAQDHFQLGLNICKDGDSRTCLGKFSGYLTTLTVKKKGFSDVSNLFFSIFLFLPACDT